MIKNTIKKYKPFFTFLIRFVLGYSLLVFLYRLYLNQFNSKLFEVDAVTEKVAWLCAKSLELFGLSSHIVSHSTQSSVLLFIGKDPVVRIIEGCNSISVIILFVAFIIAFSGSIKRTVLYTTIGSSVIFVLNIVRIALITLAIYYFPTFEHFLHEILFPILLYGVVFILWIIWVNRYSNHARDNSKT